MKNAPLISLFGITALIALLSVQIHAADLLHQWTFNADDGIEDIVGGVESVLRGTSVLTNDQLLIPSDDSEDGMQFDTEGDINLAEINSDEGGVSFVVWCTPVDYGDQKYIFQVGTKSFVSLNANSGPFPRGGVGFTSTTADDYSVTLTSKPDGGSEVMFALTLVDNADANTDEAYLALYTGPDTLYEAASSTTLEFAFDLGAPEDLKLLGDRNYGPNHINGLINEFRIYGGVLTSGEITAIAAEGPVIPEPAGLAVLGLAAVALLSRRTR